MSDVAQSALRSWTAAARAPSTSAFRRRLDVPAPLLSSVLPSDGVKKSGDPDLRPDVLQHYFSIHRRRPEVAMPLLSVVLPLPIGKKSVGPDPRTFFEGCNCQRRICITRSYSPVENMFLFLPHLHLRWGSLSKAYVCTLTVRFRFRPDKYSTVSYHRPCPEQRQLNCIQQQRKEEAASVVRQRRPPTRCERPWFS